MKSASDIRKVFPHKRFAARYDDKHFVRVNMWSDFRIYDTKKIFSRHIGSSHGRNTIASAVKAMHITTESGFPEKLLQRMQFFEILSTPPF